MKPDSVLFKMLLFYGLQVQHRGKWWVHFRLRKFFNADVNMDFEVARDEILWILNPSDYVQSELFWLGTRDYWDIYNIKKLLKPGDVFFDIGSNFGYYSIKLSHLLNKEIHVYAFEPNLPTYERLQKNIELNKLGGIIKTFQIGISDVAGAGTIVNTIGNSGGANIDVSKNDGDIELVSLDGFCQTHHINQINFIKIDVEGFEERLLRGGEEIISQLKPILFIELNPPCLARQGSSVEIVVGILKSYGYTLYYADRKKMLPLNHLPDGSDYINGFAFPNKSEP